jgi:hypothetical protein
MAKFRYWRCPDCSGVFKHLHVLSDDPPPDRCVLCGSWMSTETPPDETFVPVSPPIKKSAYARSVDQSYRAMEAASIGRAEEAASILETEYAKQPKDEFDSGLLRATQREEVAAIQSELKITNMRDPSEMREGDTAYIAPGVSQARQNLMTPTGGPGFQQLAGAVPNYAPGVGPERAGAAIHTTLNGHSGWVNGSPPTANPGHQTRASQIVRAGQLNSYVPPKN